MRIGVNTLPGRPEEHAAHWDRYMVRVLRACQALQGATQFVAYTHAHNHHLYDGCARLNLDEERGGHAAALERALKKHPVDRLLSPLTAPATNRATPQFLYTFDLAFLEQHAASQRKRAAILKSLRKACASVQGLIVSSEHLRHRCLDLLETPLDRVTVAPPGVDIVFEKKSPPLVETPYMVLHIDALAERDFTLLRKSMEQLLKELDLNLAVVGPGCPSEPKSWGDRSIRIEQTPDAQMAGLLQHATVFIYPGVDDGCALPVMEALRAGAPIVCPKSGAINEFAHTAPVYYNADAPASMIQAVRRTLVEDPKTRTSRTSQGQKAVGDYTWEQCAWKLLSTFNKVR